MPSARLPTAAMAAALISYSPTPARADPNLIAYGEHLAGECTTCHRIDGSDNGIPPIVGWPTETFLAVLNSYKEGERTNQTMISVAKSLDEKQMTALAAYFESVKPKQ